MYTPCILYLRQLSFQAKVRHQRSSVVVEVLAADTRAAVGVRIITPAEYSGIRQIFREEVAKPVDAITCRPRFLAMAVQAVDGDDTESG